MNPEIPTTSTDRTAPMPDTPNNDHPNPPTDDHQDDQPNRRPKQAPAHLDTAWSPVANAMRHDLPAPTTKQGNPIDPADPGSGFSRFAAILFTIFIVAFVVFWQNSGDDWKYKYLIKSTPPPVEFTAEMSAPGSFGQIDIMGRLYIRGYPLFESQPVMTYIDNGKVEFSEEDQLRLAIIDGSFNGNEAAIERLDALESQLEGKRLDPIHPQEPDGLILAELAALRTIYTLGPDTLEDNQRDQLADRYALLGKYALTTGLDDADAQQALFSKGFEWIGAFGIVVIFGLFFFPIVGFVLLILGIVFLAIGKLKLRNHVPAKGGSVFLETYALFVAGFVILSVAAFYVANSSRPELASLSLLAQWLLLLTVFWGILRGMPLKSWRKAIGWHTGQGLFKEIGIGIIAYIASIPIYILGIIITMILLLSKEAIVNAGSDTPVEPETLSNPILEMIATQSFAAILMLFILATTWAPIVEEAIFRGALFRHLRSSMHWVFAAFMSAFLFAFMHDYGPLLVAPLIALGFMFAFMREWRGSLVAPITAHFLHNFTLMSFMIILVQLLKDPM